MPRQEVDILGRSIRVLVRTKAAAAATQAFLVCPKTRSGWKQTIFPTDLKQRYAYATSRFQGVVAFSYVPLGGRVGPVRHCETGDWIHADLVFGSYAIRRFRYRIDFRVA